MPWGEKESSGHSGKLRQRSSSFQDCSTLQDWSINQTHLTSVGQRWMPRSLDLYEDRKGFSK